MYNVIVSVEDTDIEKVFRTFETRQEADEYTKEFIDMPDSEILKELGISENEDYNICYGIEDTTKTCKTYYDEIKFLARDVENARLVLFNNHDHRLNVGDPGEENFESVDNQLFRIQSELLRLYEYLTE